MCNSRLPILVIASSREKKTLKTTYKHHMKTKKTLHKKKTLAIACKQDIFQHIASKLKGIVK